MTTMTHTECRHALCRDDAEAARAHLRDCADCRAFAEDLRRLDDLAPTLAPAMPEGLEERLAGRLAVSFSNSYPDRSEELFEKRVVSLDDRRRWRDASRTLGVRLTAAAAALVLVVAVVTAVRGEQATPAEAVLASATATAEAGNARVDLRARTRVVLEAPPAPPGQVPAAPDFAAAPAELRGSMEAQWAQLMADFEAQMDAFFEQVDRTLDEGTSQMDEALRQMQRQLDEAMA
ncbi:MAG TPA: hypothetical protein VM307_09440, partial [Egibacteraceae bacterium]|nr:hypothetical protein [Egibacteraceae bacterium]